MVAKFFLSRRVSIALWPCVFALLAAPILSDRSHAQSGKIVLISDESSTRAVAVHAVTLQREPFDPASAMSWGNDNRTRLMLFAMGLDRNAPPSEVSATAQDGNNRSYNLTVEYVGPVPEQDWAAAVVLRLDDQMSDLGDVLIGLTYKGIASNRVRVGIGHVGDGPPDDQGAIPTPGSTAPPVTPSAT